MDTLIKIVELGGNVDPDMMKIVERWRGKLQDRLQNRHDLVGARCAHNSGHLA